MHNFFQQLVRRYVSIHSASRQPVLVFASPRGGSTWVTQLIYSQPNFCMISEPLNVRREVCARELSTTRFADLNGDAGWARIEGYYERLLSGRISEFRPMPGRRFYRLKYNRSVIKQNQGAGDLLPRLEDRFGFKVIHLLRHPIAVALSREVHPILSEYESCSLRDHFTEAENRLADRIIATGGHLEKGVLAWCIHHIPALRESRGSWLTLYYEKTVLFPHETIAALAKFLSAEDLVAIERSLMLPSNVARKSNQMTQELLKSGESRGQLVSKWRAQVSELQEQRAMSILEAFSCDIYKVRSDLPLV